MRSRGGFFLLMWSVLFAGTAAGASGKLQGLRTVVDPEGTTFVLRLPTPVEYTPSQVGPKLYLVDITDVSTDQPSDSRPVQSPLVSSYRLFTYQGADQRPHLGLEITLKEAAEVRLIEVPEGLQIRIQTAAAKPAAVTTAAVTPAAKSPMGVSLREVSVVQPEGRSGLDVEILADGELTYKTQKLTNPDRLVVDLPNTVNRIQQKHLEVNTPPLRAVRIAQFRMQPPISRVVMDLDAQVPFQVRLHPKGLVVSLSDLASRGAERETTETLKPAASPMENQITPASWSPEPASPQEATVSIGEESAAQQESKAEEASSQPIAEVSPASEPVLVASNNPLAALPTTAPAASPLAWKAEPVVAPTASPSPVLAETAPVSSPVKMEPTTAGTPALNTASQAAPEAVAEPSVSTAQPGTLLLAQQRGAAAAPSQVMMQALQQGPANYTGEPISLNLKDVDLKDFFRLMHEVSGLNIVLDPSVAGMVTIVLDEVPWDQAMDVVLKNNQLGKEVVGNVVRIARLATLETEEKQRLALATAIEQGQPRDTVTRTLSYAQAAGLVATLKRFLSARGELVPDPRTNTLIITDIPANISQIDRLIGALDRKTQQVEIEARIVSASRSFARDIGTQLAASGLTGNVTLGGTGIVGTSPVGRGTVPPLFIGAAPPQPEPGEPPEFANVSQPLAVNFGAVGATSGFTFLLTGGSTFALDAIITAAESRGIGKLLSRPKIITQNNVEANVEQGIRIPIQTNVNNTISVQYTKVVLRLTVTPQITADGTVFLKTDIENTTINPGIPRILGIPALNTQAATTQVLVSNGGTVFFGGIIQTDNFLTEQQVPLLGSIPLVGNLFKRKSTSSSTNELLFFITPKIAQS